MAEEQSGPLAEWCAIEGDFLSTGDADRAYRALSATADLTVTKAFQATLGAAFRDAALYASGEFARRELVPRSGAEILILFGAAPDAGDLSEPLAAFERSLGQCGMDPAVLVRTVPECLEAGDSNLDLAVKLLDRRFLAGDTATRTGLEDRWPAFLARHGAKISQRICRATRARHSLWHDTFRHLRPDLMTAPGGILDLRVVDWLGRLNPERREAGEALEEAARFFRPLRLYLRCRDGCGSDLLDNPAQEHLAALPAPRRSRTEWMREYYSYARAAAKAASRALDATEKSESSLLDNFRDYRSRLSNDEFTVSRERLLLRHPRLESDPAMAFRMLEYVARHGVAPGPETDRRLESAAPAIATWSRQQRPLWPLLRNILALPSSAMALRVLIDAGLMAAVIPEWAGIENLAAFEPDRKYTVDQHTLALVEAFAGLRAGSDGPRRRFAELAGEIDNPASVVCALILHDLGKAAPRDDLERRTLEWLQPSPAERSDIKFLIDNQRELPSTGSARDLEDPAMARRLAGRIGTVERLKMLAVMTCAGLCALDLDATAAAWRLEQLWRVYDATRRELTRELETDRISEPPEGLPALADFVKGFPARYLRSRSAAELAAHIDLFELSRPTGVAVRLETAEGGYRINVVARDRPYLFASLAGAISSLDLNILKAEAYANTRGIILDTFVFADPRRILQLNPPEAERLTDLLRRVALGKTDAQRLMRGRAQVDPRNRPAPPEVRFDSEACDTATLVEVSAEDRPGLLYSLAMAFSTSNCNIDVVLIDTQRHRAIDVFYVAYEGRKLSAEVQDRIREKLVAAC